MMNYIPDKSFLANEDPLSLAAKEEQRLARTEWEFHNFQGENSGLVATWQVNFQETRRFLRWMPSAYLKFWLLISSGKFRSENVRGGGGGGSEGK